MNAHVERIALAIALSISHAAIHPVLAKPIAYANGATVMAEYGADTMIEAQAFYAPSYRYSLGGGRLSLNSALSDATRDITYLRMNYLPKRWNLEAAQANVFVWGSMGQSQIGGREGRLFAWNAGGQFDYETRLLYASLRTDFHESSAYSHRIDTLQLGVAPYKHDYDTLAVWFVIQGRQYTGELSEGTEWAALVRLFKRNAWLEAGPAEGGKIQAMLMLNF